MPELPEVETTRRGLAPTVEHHRIERAIVRHRGMRLPVPRGLEIKIGEALERLRARAAGKLSTDKPAADKRPSGGS